jgi:hypothetical protein
MKKYIPPFLLTILLSSCNGWIIQPLPGPTAFLPATPTPSIFTPTPVVIGVATSTPLIATSIGVPTLIPASTATTTPAPTQTFVSSGPSISVKVLGCNTSVDVTHGMGEVTNAYVTLKNTGGVELTNIKVTLDALDEGRVHPDKTAELTSLPVSYQVIVKLTVDSTYKKETPIQVETSSDQGVFPLEGLASCTEIGIFEPKPDGLKTPIPIVP